MVSYGTKVNVATVPFDTGIVLAPLLLLLLGNIIYLVAPEIFFTCTVFDIPEVIGAGYKNVTLALTLNELKFDLLVVNLTLAVAPMLIVNSFATACAITSILDSTELARLNPVKLPKTTLPDTVNVDSEPTEVILV